MVVFFLLITLLSGCSKFVLKSDVDPSVDISKFNTFYVQKFASDERGLEKIIATKLKSLGYKATSGAAPQPSIGVDSIVTYNDRWFWDITMYMLEINLQFHDPENNYIFASGNSYRTSLVRKPPEYMIEQVLRDMLGKSPMPKEKDSDLNEDF